MPALRPRILTLAVFAVTLAIFPGVPAGSAVSEVPCQDGFANQYPCLNVDLLGHLSNGATGGGGANDIWGWTDPETGREYALVGKTNGTAFVDITDPTAPAYLGLLPTTGSTSTSAGVLSSWRDIKVHDDHAFIVSEEPAHGVQVFDLTRLRGATSPQEWTIDSLYPLATSAHNIAINEESGYAYVLGHISGLATPAGACSGLHMIDINEPTTPLPAGCFELDGYTHDAQCVIYRGPDERYQDSEICLNSNEDTLTIVDVTTKALAEQLSRTGYPGANYTHQGWLTEDHRYFLLSDEGDEQASGVNSTTYIFDVADLTAPELIGVHRGRTRAIDHNLYTKGDLVYQANYRAGLAVLSLEDIADGALREVGYFDIYPGSDGAAFNGAWSVYPYFESGSIVLNGMEQGLFVLRPRIADVSVTTADSPDPVAAGGTLTYTLTVENAGPYEATGVALTDTLPAGATLLSASGAACTAGTGVVTCDIGSLAAGEQAVVALEVAAPSASGEITNTARVSSNAADHIAGNDVSTETTTVA